MTTVRTATTGHVSIGELADRTGVSAATLRMWETRHGFPTAERLPNGHRRYSADQVDRVLDVQRRRRLGVRLETAIQQSDGAATAHDAESVYAGLVRRHPGQPRQRLRKLTLLGLSWAIEDEIAASGARGHLFGAFQKSRYFDRARDRWAELARVAHSAHAFADFGDAPPPAGDGPALCHLVDHSPMRREWNIVHDGPHQSVALTAWELPGQSGTPDRDRFFESVWTVDPAAVRDAARTCARVAASGGDATAVQLLDGPLAGPVAAPTDPLELTRLTHRAIGYLDAGGRP